MFCAVGGTHLSGANRASEMKFYRIHSVPVTWVLNEDFHSFIPVVAIDEFVSADVSRERAVTFKLWVSFTPKTQIYP